MRFLQLTLLSVTLVAYALTTDAQTEVQSRVYPLSTLAIGPHPDSIDGRNLAAKRAIGCNDPGFPNLCGNECCMVILSSLPRFQSRLLVLVVYCLTYSLFFHSTVGM